MKNLVVVCALALLGWASTPAIGQEIGYIEDFALTKDRAKALQSLIPGTRDYYYYHCLHYQNNEQYDQVEDLLKAWIKKHGYSAQVYEIQNRQALLTYSKNPDETLEHIRRRLNLHFNHRRERLDEKSNLPVQLAQNLISRGRLQELAFRRYKNLKGMEDSALDWLIEQELDPERRRDLLQRLARPDYVRLPQLVANDLNHRYSRGFGSMTIHRQMLRSQLDELLKLKPDLLNQTAFVQIYLTKLWPNPDVDWRNNAQAHAAYLDRLIRFVRRLAPAHNSLKAHVLYHRLALDRSQGRHNRALFMEYIKLPRRVSYIDAKYMQREVNRRYPANLSANFAPHTLLPAVGGDEALVRSYLAHFFTDENTYQPYTTYINDIYLKHLFAETKIVNGLGEGQAWHSLLPPEQYKALRDRVDLDFAADNKKQFSVDQPVRLDLYVKNAPSLLVKLYKINTPGFYRKQQQVINTDINLDGLVPHHQQTLKYEHSPFRRVRRHFEFPQCDGRGVYVIDFIGNGKASRALIRKGKLRFLERVGSAGHVFTVIDENNRPLKDAKIWMADRQYAPDEQGEITIPFTNQPGRRAIVLEHGDFASLDYFNHQAERYYLNAGFYIDREAMLARRKAALMVRPSLRLGAEPVTLSLLTDVRLVLTATDLDGVATNQEVKDFKLFEDRESLYEFQVPPRLATLSVALRAKVKNLSKNQEDTLASQETFNINQIDRTEKVEDLHFSHIGGEYFVDLLGKTGEPKADRPINLVFKHVDFRNPVNTVLQTNTQGRVALGKLEDIVTVKGASPQGVSRTWRLPEDRSTYYTTINAQEGAPIVLPYMGRPGQPVQKEISLLEVRGGTYVADRLNTAKIKDGMLTLAGLPRGDYRLTFKHLGISAFIRVGKGETRDGYVFSPRRRLEKRGGAPLQITQVDVGEDNITVQLANATRFTRVHVFATRFQPAWSAFPQFAKVRDAEPTSRTIAATLSAYVAGRNIGDEYRYILERAQAKKYPGNMLERPGVLLNPWAVRKTDTGQQRAQGGEKFAATPPMEPDAENARPGGARGRQSQLTDFSDLGFLADASLVLTNLTPNDDGVVIISKKDVGKYQQLQIAAVDPLTTVYRQLSLPAAKPDYVDLRLVDGLDPQKHFTQQKQITLLDKGKTFELSDIVGARFESYDSLARVYALYVTLSRDPKLLEFGFLLNWPILKPAEKQTLYSKHACHELNYFLSQKDPEFFEKVVAPHLANKRDRTFLDDWLLREDVEGYLEPWSYNRLNIVERILLSRRIDGEQPYSLRQIQDLLALIPPNIERFNYLFNTAVAGTSLEADDRLGLTGAIDKSREIRKLELFDRRAGDNGRALGGKIAPGAAAPRPPTSRPSGAASDAPAPSLKPESKELAERSKNKANEKMDMQGQLRSRRRAGRGGRSEGGQASGKEAGRYFRQDGKKRAQVQQFYRRLEKTQEWAENNYYKLPIDQQNDKLVTVNAFWRDYAQHDDGPFLSRHFAEASRNFTEMMFALSVLDLPFTSPEHKTTFADAKMKLDAGGRMIVLHEGIQAANAAAEKTPILVSQNFFRHGDRYETIHGERRDKFVADEFLTGVPYGCQVVVTNPTSSRQKLDVLLQIPRGAMAIAGSRITRSVHLNLEPYRTQTLEYYFYFPAPGEFVHYPVHAAKNEEYVATADPFTFKVVNKLSRLDTTSWAYVSQHGSSDDVLRFLKERNLYEIDLAKIAFRMSDETFFEQVLDVLTRRHVYNHTLWSYAVKHNQPPAIRQFLQHANRFVAQCGQHLQSELLVIDPIVRRIYQHLEYRPLVNARAHSLGKRRKILNGRFHSQYHQLLKVLGYHRALNDDDLLAVTYYLLLQDRIEEALDFFGRVNPANLATRLQYDYFAAHLAFFTEETQQARQVAAKYVDYPVERWRHQFVSVIKQLDELEGKTPEATDEKNRTQVQTQLASKEPSFDFHLEGKSVAIRYQNLSQVKVNYYLMDIELLFSRNPFVQQFAGQFSQIRPNQVQSVELPKEKAEHAFTLPKELDRRNVLVEIVAGGKSKMAPYYSNTMAVQVTPNYGQLKVTQADRKPERAAYIKVYAQMNTGEVRFYKDGYTDLRGRFDYTSLNTNEIDQVQKFAILVLSDEHGAVVREAAPPQR